MTRKQANLVIVLLLLLIGVLVWGTFLVLNHVGAIVAAMA